MKTLLAILLLFGLVSCKSIQVKDRSQEINDRKMKPEFSHTRSGRFIKCYTHVTELGRGHEAVMNACGEAFPREK